MAVKIEFGKSPESLESHNEDEVSKMQECISHIEAGEAERCIPILKALISGEAEETKEEVEEEKPMGKPSFRDQISKSI